jgi:hypothetical protein
MLLALLAPKVLFPVCCFLCLLPKTYLQYAVGFACSQRLISSMLFTLLAPKDLIPVCCLLCLLPMTYLQSQQHTGNKSLGARKVNSILEISLWEQAKPTTYWK